VTAAVIDGVAVTPPICAAPGCGGEFSSTIRHRFCVLHFAQHGVCGVVSGPLGEGSCGESVAEIPLDDWVGERRALRKVACRGHSLLKLRGEEKRCQAERTVLSCEPPVCEVVTGA
jgi:CxC6 like cysteine cluster associated with KDZ transposases